MSEPTVSIRPPAWFARLAVGAAGAALLLGLVAAVGSLGAGRPVAALLSMVGGAGLAAMSFDVSRRRVDSQGDVLEVHQWYRVVHLRRDEVDEFTPARGSFFRWDIVAVREDRPQLRLWVSRMLIAGRERRSAWLVELEAWRTWIGVPGRA